MSWLYLWGNIMSHTYSNNLFHIIFSVKDRCSLIADAWQEELYRYLTGIARAAGCQVVSIGGVTDHIHILVLVKPSLAISDLIGKLKANSSRWMKERFQPVHGFQWQPGFSSFSVSRSVAPRVSDYIAGQAAHHSKVSFQQELSDFYNRHEIKYEPTELQGE